MLDRRPNHGLGDQEEIRSEERAVRERVGVLHVDGAKVDVDIAQGLQRESQDDL